MTDYLLRFVAAGLLVAAIPWVAAHTSDRLAGLVLLFPAVTLSGFFVLGAQRGTTAVAEASGAAVSALPAVLAFLVAVHLAARERMPLVPVLLIGLLAWLVAASLVTLIASRLGGEQ